MRIVPVIDIRNGVAVRAIAGRRADYRPLRSALTQESTPLAVARGLMAFYPFDALYIADLDAIEGRDDNRAAVHAIAECFPSLELWVDPGVRRRVDALPWRNQQNVRLALGSESLASLEELGALTASGECILSLDFQDARFLGDPEILEKAALWPSTVIVMTLARVGGGDGPDIARLGEIVGRANGRAVYGAGGVRHADDLHTLANGGAAGVLVASALHDGRVTAAQLASCATLSAT